MKAFSVLSTQSYQPLLSVPIFLHCCYKGRLHEDEVNSSRQWNFKALRNFLSVFTKIQISVYMKLDQMNTLSFTA